MTETSASSSPAQLTRRSVIAGAAAIGVGSALAACSSSDDSGASGSSGSAPTTVKAADVPVGGAKIQGEVVVSQPTAGNYKAFSAVCTHQQCRVSQVQGTTITCVCHNSQFSAVDGSVIQGPANTPLNPRTVTLNSDTLTIA